MVNCANPGGTMIVIGNLIRSANSDCHPTTAGPSQSGIAGTRPPDDQIDVAAGAGRGRVADTNPRRGLPISVGHAYFASPWRPSHASAPRCQRTGSGLSPGTCAPQSPPVAAAARRLRRRTRQRSRPSCARSVESARAETAPAAAAAAVRGGEIQVHWLKGARLRHHDVVEQALAELKTCAWTI